MSKTATVSKRRAHITMCDKSNTRVSHQEDTANPEDTTRREGALPGAATLSGTEREALEAAFASGARGGVLIGLKDGQRLLTLFLPEGNDQLDTNVSRLRRMGCDQAIWANRE